MKYIVVLASAIALSACAGMTPAIGPKPSNAMATHGSASAAHVYAFFSNATTSLASFPLDANGETMPAWNLAGKNTRLQQGHGIAIGPTGILYVLAGSPGQPLRLLQFGKDKHGNARPAASYRFPSSLLVDYTIGLGIDNAGNFWISDGPGSKIRAFAVRGKRLVQVAAFAPRLHTSIGWKSTSPSALFVDGSNHLYCWSNFLYHGFGEIGLTEYDIADPIKPHLMRTFFDPGFPDVPPDTMSVDGKGRIYAANGIYEDGVRVYPPKWVASQPPVSVIGAHERNAKYELGEIAALATLADGTLYVAVGANGKTQAGIVVYPPGAHDDPVPKHILTNAQYLQYADGLDYGNLLAIR